MIQLYLRASQSVCAATAQLLLRTPSLNELEDES